VSDGQKTFFSTIVQSWLIRIWKTVLLNDADNLAAF